VTYAGFKSLIYANMDRDDKRVTSALDWISKNYTLDANPGMPESQKLQGLYYYYLAKGRALNAFGHSTIEVVDGGKSAKIMAASDAKLSDVIAKMDELKAQGIEDIAMVSADAAGKADLKPGEIKVVIEQKKVKRDWANDLIDTITARQHKEGWWANSESRWLESQPVLVTAYSIIALQNAID